MVDKPRGRPPDPDRQSRRRAELTQAAFALFLSRGLEAVTVDEIVARAECSKGTFYRYFDDKRALVTRAFAPLSKQIREAFGELGDTVAAAPDEAAVAGAYQRFAGRMGMVLLEDRAAARLYLQERRGPPVAAREPIAELAAFIETQAVQTARIAEERGVLRRLDPAVIGVAIVGAIEQVLHVFLQDRLEADVVQVADELTRLVVRGLLPDGAGRD
jgi:AcrR family transcriptional regulator